VRVALVRVALVRVALVRVALVRVALVRVALVRVALVRVPARQGPHHLTPARRFETVQRSNTVVSEEQAMPPGKETRRIGLLLPSSNTTQEPEFIRMLPDGVTLHVARLPLRTVEADSTIRIVADIEAESRKLADAEVDAIVLAATAPSSRHGLGYDQDLIRRITAASGKPATTASTALIQALATLRAHRLVIAAPWGDDVNRIAAGFIEASGYQVLAHRALGHVSNLEIGLLAEETALELGRAVDRPDADVVMLACGNWRTLGIVDRLEAAVGKPVLTTNQVSLWAVLRLVGVTAALPGCGILLRTHMADPIVTGQAA
jgi:maleate isomerase